MFRYKPHHIGGTPLPKVLLYCPTCDRNSYNGNNSFNHPLFHNQLKDEVVDESARQLLHSRSLASLLLWGGIVTAVALGL